jgi:hypothetical protein
MKDRGSEITPLFPGLGRAGVVVLSTMLLCSAIFARDGMLQGTVLDAEKLWPLEGVSVYLVSEGMHPRLETATDSAGRFAFAGLELPRYDVFVSAVGYGLVKKAIELDDSEILELEILLLPGTRLATEVTVTADRSRSPSELASSEIEQLRTVLIDDPIRSIQALPSLVASDDFNTGFAFQGSGFDRVGIQLDGVPVYSFLHTIEGLEDSGSTTILSAELVDGLDFQPGGTSGQWASNSAGLLSIRTRSGNNVRLRNRAFVSGSAFSFVSEGPLARGNWIASARKSYVDWIVRRIDPNSELNFGFYDFFGKVNQSLSSRQQLGLTFFHGNTGLKDVVEGSSITSTDRGRLRSQLVNAAWDWECSSQLTASTDFYFQTATAENENRLQEPLWEGEQDIWGLRSTWSFRPTERVEMASGVTAEWWSVSEVRNLYSWGEEVWKPLYQFDESTDRQHLFAEISVQVIPYLRVKGGWNWSRQNRLVSNMNAPHAGVEYSRGGHHLAAFWGESGQFPFFNQLYGPVGDLNLRPENSTVFQASWNYRSPKGVSLLLSGYHRKRSDVPWRPQGLWRTVDGIITPPSTDVFINVLEDRSYGAEVRLGRQVPIGLSGWVGYAWGKSRWSEEEGIWFPGNYDQRNGISLFGNYRWASRIELSAKIKISSGLPLPAYAVEQDGRYYVSEYRNLERLPTYGRFDVRFGKTFNKDRYRITLFIEVINLTNRENLRFSGHDYGSVNPRTGQIRGLTQEQFPILPTAGVIAEF